MKSVPFWKTRGIFGSTCTLTMRTWRTLKQYLRAVIELFIRPQAPIISRCYCACQCARRRVDVLVDVLLPEPQRMSASSVSLASVGSHSIKILSSENIQRLEHCERLEHASVPLPFWVSKNIKVGVCKKSYETPSGWTQNASCLRHGFTKMCFWNREECTLKKCRFFEISSALIFVVFTTINKMSQGASKICGSG